MIPWFVWFIAGGLILPPAFIALVCLHEYLVEKYGRVMKWALAVVGYGVAVAASIAITTALIHWWGQP